MSDKTINKVIRFLANEANRDDIKEVLSWRKENPEEFRQIKLIFENTPFEVMEFSSDEWKQKVFEKISVDTDLKQQSTKIHPLAYWLKVAAIFTGLIAIGLSMYFYNNSLVYQETNFTSELIEFKLPDGTTVTLDENTTLTYKKTWLNRFNRKVDVNGRAYFQVEKFESQNFIVNVSESQIEVLGTKFSVSDHFGKTQVILHEGKIRVTSQKVDQSFLLTGQGEQLIISNDGTVRQSLVNENLYFSWLQSKLNFNYCKVSETLDFLSDSYNMKLEMNDQDALNIHLYGSAPSDNPHLILEAIAQLTDKKIEEIEETIIFK